MKVTRERMERIAVGDKKPGFMAAVEAISTEVDGVMTMDAGAYDAVFKEYTLPPEKRGIGDFLSAVIHPVAVATDAVLGTYLVSCPGCNSRKLDLNDAGVSKGS